MNPLLAIGQIIVSIALIAAILLQARGTGLSGHVRRRLGRLPQPARHRAPAVAVHDRPARPVRRLLARVVHLRPSHRPPDPRSRRPDRDDRVARSSMNRIDSLVVGTLVVLLASSRASSVARRCAAVASTTSSGARRESPRRRRARTARASSADPSSVSPLAARTQADRDLVALVFAGLVRNGPDGTIVPDLASAGRSTPTGATWTFELRDRRRWHDGEPVTADDVVFTVGPPGSRLPRPGRRLVERGHGRDRRTPHGRVHARDPARRLPPGRDPADRPGPPPRRHRRSAQLAERSVRPRSRSGPGRSPSTSSTRHGRARPGGHDPADAGEPSVGTSPAATDSLATPARPTARPTARAGPGRHRVPLLRRRRALAARVPGRASSTPPRACRRRRRRGPGRRGRQPGARATRARR